MTLFRVLDGNRRVKFMTRGKHLWARHLCQAFWKHTRIESALARGRVAPDALHEGPAAPTGVATSVSDRPTGVSPDPNLNLGCSRACHQTDHHLAPPWSRSLHSVSPRHHEVRSAQQGIGAGTRGRSTVGMREGTTSTVNDGSRPDTIAGAYQARGPTGPAGNSMPVKLPPSRCSRHAVGIAAPRPSRSSSSPHRRRRSHAGDRPARTQMGPGGPRSGPGTRRRPPHATTPPGCQGQHRHRAYRRRPPPGRRAAAQPSITTAVTSPGRETNARSSAIGFSTTCFRSPAQPSKLLC
ncbi:hypothetical protein CFC21_010323 [Triticum aestivum]|uniref:Uncharacterized protein n=2 Tax=Triticum aestivum TaxID=4565 RepID=A0A9R1DKG0_WHEAT|nr:hypothetical protein CFC21_010323 [Triticum aestivum]